MKLFDVPPMFRIDFLEIGRTTTKNEKRSANTLYQELSFQDNEESEENEVTGSWVHPGEYASSGIFDCISLILGVKAVFLRCNFANNPVRGVAMIFRSTGVLINIEN